MKAAALFLALLVIATASFLRSAPAGARVERFTVRSPSMDREIQAWAVLPPAYSENNDTRFPVL
jgi:hypothetical protein